MTTLGNPLLLGGEGYQISRSVRLRSSASAYFNRTFVAPTNNTRWSWSNWLKLGQLGSSQMLLGADDGTTNNALAVVFQPSGVLRLFQTAGGVNNVDVSTSAVFRDPSAYYHIEIVYDSANATANDRIQLYVNGVRQAVTYATGPFAQNTVSQFNVSSRAHNISKTAYNLYFDGYLTEINFIDGQALTPSSFGETDVITGVWKPKKYAGTYGTNGFYLNFSDNSAATAAAIGKDSSGNGNNWTPNNISVTAGATYDSMIDVPTLYADGGNGRGNYATLNPLNSFSTSVAPNEGNLRYRSDSSAWRSATSTLSMRQGKWYAEFSCSFIATGSAMAPGIVPSTASFIGTTNTANTLGYGYFNDGDTYALGTASASGTTYATNDVIGIAFDADAGKLWFSKNGVWIASGDPATGANARYSGITGEWCFALGSFVSHAQTASFANFGQRPFAYTPPTGFKALNTQNLPEPTIKNGNEYFDVALVTGSATVPQTITVNFAPNFLWSKCRNNAVDHGLYDTVRGGNQILSSNTTGSEATTTGNIVTFNSNGATLQAGGSFINDASRTYVDWMWKESASAGFDIVTYTGTGANRTVAHSLGVAPSMIIFKRRNSTSNWPVYHVSNGNTAGVYLNGTNAKNTSVDFWNNTSPTSTVFTLGAANEVNVNTSTNVAYCFSEVAGFSKFGSYTGNGSTDGPFVFCGFRPAFVMIKRTDSTADWYSRDAARDTYNPVNNTLFSNTSAAEENWGGAYPLDFTSNGFKLRTSVAGFNASGGTYIFMAFAESPFKNALAR